MRQVVKRVTVGIFRFRVWQQAQRGLTLSDQKRLIMTILADQQDQTANTGETIGMTLNKIFELYHRQSPKFVPSKLADSESSIQQAVRELWMDEFIEKVVSPRAGTVSTHRLTAQGWDYVNKIRDLEDERNQLFESCVASEEERKYVETYLNRVADTIETRMARGSVN